MGRLIVYDAGLLGFVDPAFSLVMMIEPGGVSLRANELLIELFWPGDATGAINLLEALAEEFWPGASLRGPSFRCRPAEVGRAPDGAEEGLSPLAFGPNSLPPGSDRDADEEG